MLLATCYKFSESRIKSGQLHADWVAGLRGLASSFTCGFASCKTSYADDMMIEVIIRNTPLKYVDSAYKIRN